MRIGIMGGTLDPVHNGHLEIARTVQEKFALDGVMLLPAGDPPHKKRESDKLDRLEMARRAAASCGGMTVSGMEVLRAGTTYTVDTLRQLHEQRPDVEWVYIIGADTVNTLETWRSFDQVAKLCTFAAVGRPGFDEEKTFAHAQWLKDTFGAEVVFAETVGPDISSTDVRRRVAEGKSIDDLVPAAVAEYIREKGLYLCAYPWNEIERKLSERLKPGRFHHTLGVAETARRLALKFGIDPQRARLAGLLHDCAKAMEPEVMEKLIRAENMDVDEDEFAMTPVLHAPAGMIVAREEFGVRDPEILSAIRRHTLGDGGMTPLETLIFLADFIEPTRRPFPGLRDVREAAETDLYAAARMAARMSGEHVISRGGKVHPRTCRMFE